MPDDFANPYDQGPLNYDPFPGTTYGNAYGPQLPGNDFPINDFRMSSLASGMFDSGTNPMQNYEKAIQQILQPPASMQSYQDFVNQGPPTRQANEPGFWTRLGIGLTGATQALYDPKGSMGTIQDLLGEKYNKAMQDYTVKKAGLENAINIQEGANKNAITLLPELMKMKELGYEFGVTSGQKGQEIAQTGAYQRGQLGNTAESNRLRALQDAATANYQASQAGTAGMNAQTARDKALAETPAMINELNARANYYNRPQNPGLRPSAASIQAQTRMAITTDPILSQFFHPEDPEFSHGPIPGLDYSTMAADPAAFQAFQRLVSKYGMLDPTRPNDINLP